MDWKGVLTYVFVLAILAAVVISIVQLGLGA
jgi:hypothetical protein